MGQTDTNASIVRRLCEGWPKMTLGDYEEVMAPECVYLNIPRPNSPRIGPQAAHAALSRYRDWRVDLEVIAIVAEGDLVFAERIETFFEPGSSEGHVLPVTGAFKVKDGKIVEWRDYFDSAQVLWSHS